MARFNLVKDEAVSMSALSRDFGLGKAITRVRVDLKWKGADLDVQAFCLGLDGQIVEDADFVFYNSERRTVLPTPGETDNDYMARIVEVPFEKAKYGNKPNWRKQTAPLSADNSVIGSYDDLTGENDGETLRVDLSKVRPGIETILFTVTVHGNETFGDVSDAHLVISNIDTGDELARYDINEQFGSETALIAARFDNNDEGEWEFKAVGDALDGGLETLVDMYAS